MAASRRVRLVDEPDEAGLHGVEGVGGPADLDRAAFRQRRAVDVPPELVGGRGEQLQRARDPAHRDVGQQQHRGEQDREGQQHAPGQARRFLRDLGVEDRPGPVLQADLDQERDPVRAGIGACRVRPSARPWDLARALGRRPAPTPGACRSSSRESAVHRPAPRAAPSRTSPRGAPPSRPIPRRRARDPATPPAAARSESRRSGRARPGSANPAG